MPDNTSMGIGPIGTAAIGAGSGIISNIMDIAFGKMRQRQALEGQKKSQEISSAAQLDMWNKTNFEAQKEHIKNAGLSTGLMYGMGGAVGGTTGSTAGTVPGGQGGGGMDIAGAAQLALLNAQKENIEANTEKTKAETGNVPLTGKEIISRTAKLNQETKTEEERTLTQKLENGLKTIQMELEGRTLEDQVMMVKQNLQKIGEEAQILLDNGKIREEYWDEYVKAQRATYASVLIDNQAKKMGIALDAAQIGKIQRELEIAFENAISTRAGVIVNEKRLEWDKKMKNISDAAKMPLELIGNILKGLIIVK